MNKKFTIIIVVTTVLLVALLIVLGILRSKPQMDSTSDQFALPTNFPNNQGGGGNSRNSRSSSSGNNNSNSSNRAAVNINGGNGFSATPRQVATASPQSKVEQDALRTIHNFLPYNSDSLAVDYSSLTGKIYIQKKNEKADEELRKFLETNNLNALYNKFPELFVTTPSSMAVIISNEEQKIEFSPEADTDVTVPSGKPTPTLSYSQQRDQNQTKAFNGLARTLFDIGTISKEIIQTKTNTTFTIQPIQNVPSEPIARSPILYDKDTANIPCAAGTDNGPADGYSKGVLTRIRVCRVNGFVVNSQISKQFFDMTNAATAAGMSFIAKGFSGSFRTMAGQINIYQSHCRSDGIVGSPPPYPKPAGQTIRCPGGGAPGYSNHQMGLGFDLGCDGVGIPRSYAAASQNRCFQWLVANAGKYGFFEYGYGKTRDGSTGYEGWHWSVNGN